MLAVGLYATASAEFAVTGKGEETVNYLQMRKAILESGEWVDPTLEGEVLNLQLVINRRGKKPAEVVFQEYMGERASINQETYKEEVVGNPRAVMILMNPKMEILRDAGRRNEMIGQIKDIISYLSGPGMRCEHVAFVITAADLLTTSLKDYKEEFDGYKEEITNCLNTNPKFQNAWKEFEVTVTGPLEDPEHPRIARADGNTSRKPFEWLIEQIDKADAKKRISKIGHRIVTLLLLGCIVFSGYRFYIGRVDENKYRMLRKEFKELKENAKTKATAKNIKDFSDKVDGWEPRTEKGRENKRSLVSDFNGDKCNMCQQYDAKYAKDESVAFETNAEEFINRLGNAALNLDDGPSINEVLVECKRYEKWAQTEGAKPEIDFETRKETWKKIKQRKKNLLDNLLTRQIGRLGSDGTVSKEDEEFLKRTLLKDGALSKEEYNDWMNKLNQEADNKRKGWVLAQDRKCDEFIAKIRDCTKESQALNYFKDCCRDYSNAPKLGEVAKAASDVVIEGFEKIYNDTEAYLKGDNGARYNSQMMQSRSKEMQGTYNDLKVLVNTVMNVGKRFESFKGTDAYKFAEGCQNYGIVGISDEFQQEYTIKKIEVKIDYAKGNFSTNFKCVQFEAGGIKFDKLNGSFSYDSLGKCKELGTKDNGWWREIWSGNARIKGSPWSDAYLSLTAIDVNKCTSNETEELMRYSLVSGEGIASSFSTNCVFHVNRITGDKTPNIAISVKVEESGTNFFRFARQYLFKGGK